MNIPQDFALSVLRLPYKSSAINPGAAVPWFPRGLPVLILLVASAMQVQATVTEYASRSSWDAAVGGAPDTTETFNGAADIVEFDTGGPYSASGFTLSATSSAGDTFANFVDGNPVSGANVINTGADAPHAHMFVDGDALPSGAVPQQVTLTFPNPVFAWGANLEVNPTGTETVTIELRRADNGLEGTLTLANGVTAFRGFTSTTAIKTLVIKGSGNSATAGRTVGMDDVVIKVNAPVANTAPGASVIASNVLPTDTGETSYSFTVTYTDNSAISVATINAADVTVTGPGGALSVTGASVDIGTDGTPRVATYTVTPPGGSWNLADNGTYTIAMVGSQVGDNGSPQLFVPAGTLGTFTVRARSLIASTFSNKGAWETAIGGPGATDFTEDFEGFATQDDFSSAPVSAPGKFTLQRVGGANVFGNFIDVNSGVQTGDVPGVPVKYAAMFLDVDSGLTVEMTFATPVAAWYGEFSSAIDQEDIEIDLKDAGGNIIDIVEINANGSFGFTTPSPGTVSKLVFRGVNANGTGGELFALDNISAANDYTANSNPIFTLIEADDVVPAQTGATTYSFTLSYSDNSAINVSSIGTADVSVTGPGGALTVTGAVANNPANGTPRTVTYTVVPPGGAWSFGDNGTYTIGILANQVLDDTGNAVAAAPAAASFEVRVSSGITTVFTDRTAWTTAVGGAGGISWNEDFEGFLTQQDFSAGPVSAPGKFALERVGGVNLFGNFIDVDSGTQSGDVPGVPVKYAAMFVDGDSALTVVMTFDDPVSAWIGQFFNATDTEDIEIDLYDEANARIDIIEVNANNGSVGFVGPTARIKKLVFRGLSNTASGGEVFGLDNISAANPHLDFGDAPDPGYPTVIANNGARHSIPFAGATLFLGSNPPDFENDGQPNGTATGDGSDEDGLAWPALVTAGQNASVTVTSSGAGFVNVWIDYNRDGDWADAGEHVFTDTAVAAGPNTLNFAPPISVTGGSSFARARLTSANSSGSLSFVGLASDGEVEDSVVVLNAAPTAGPDVIQRRGAQDTKVLLSTLLANDSDPDADTLSITAVGSPLPAGASAVIAGEWVFYTPPGGSSAPGSFTYTLSDGRGGIATGAVTVNITNDTEPSQNEVAIQNLGGGVFQITFNGIPNRTYSIEYTENLNPPNTVWAPLGQASTDATGVGVFNDSSGSAQRIYRTVYP